MADDKLEFQGIVLDTSKGIFTVGIETEGGAEMMIKAKIAGRLRINDIRILVGDVVQVECSPYDLTMGRIIKRYRTDQM